MKYIVSISGGIDSTACLLYMLERAKKEDIIPVFCDTKWEADETYEYLFYLEKALDIEIIRLDSIGFVEMCKKHHILTNMKLRFCTFDLKIKPFLDYIYDNFLSKKIDFIVVEGIRREESRFRQNTETFEIKKEKINKQVFEIKKLYPIAYWDTERVFEYIASKGIDVNPLYNKGFRRVGCMPCIYANKHEILNLPEKYKQRVRDLEEMMNKEYLKKRTNYITFFESNRQKFLYSRSLFEEAE